MGLSQLFQPNSKPTLATFPELTDYMIWIRFIIAVGYGVWLGTSGQMRGGAGLMFGLNFVAFVPTLYCNSFLGADQESYGTKLLFSGVVNAFATMILVWMYFYTIAHEDDEQVFKTALMNAANMAINTNDNPAEQQDTVDNTASVTEPQFEEESEF